MAPAVAKGSGVKPRRKRARKTRTAVVSDASSSSSSSSSSSGSDSSDEDVTSISAKKNVAKAPARTDEEMDVHDSSSSDEGGSSSSSSSSSGSSSDEESDSVSTLSRTSKQSDGKGDKGKRRLQYSPPPQSQSDAIDSGDEMVQVMTLKEQSKAMRPPAPVFRSTLIDVGRQKRKEAIAKKQEKRTIVLDRAVRTPEDISKREEDFQAIYMRIVVDEFGEELDALRKKEPTLNSSSGSRMPLLIDALQAGSELFSRGDASSDEQRVFQNESDEVALMLWGNRSEQ